MQLFKYFGSFIRAVSHHWFEVVIGVLFSIGGLLLQLFFWANPNVNVPFQPWMLWLPGIVLLFFSSFSAWRDEHLKAVDAGLKLARSETAHQVFDVGVSVSGVSLVGKPGTD